MDKPLAQQHIAVRLDIDGDGAVVLAVEVKGARLLVVGDVDRRRPDSVVMPEAAFDQVLVVSECRVQVSQIQSLVVPLKVKNEMQRVFRHQLVDPGGTVEDQTGVY